MNTLEINVLQILSTQAEDYLAMPDASCFVAAGIQPAARVDEALIALQGLGYVEFYQDIQEDKIIAVKRDENGEIVYNENNDVTVLWETDPQIIEAVLDKDGKTIITPSSFIPGKYKTVSVVTVINAGWIITNEGKTALASL